MTDVQFLSYIVAIDKLLNAGIEKVIPHLNDGETFDKGTITKGTRYNSLNELYELKSLINENIKDLKTVINK